MREGPSWTGSCWTGPGSVRTRVDAAVGTTDARVGATADDVSRWASTAEQYEAHTIEPGTSMQALLWRDYLCPWCYLGRDRTALLEQLGVRVTPMSYELHPEVPPGGRAVRSGGRLDRVLDRIAAECAAVGLDFVKPARMPNTRHALETAEVLRSAFPDALPAFDDACYRVQWVERGDLGDVRVVRELVAGAGADPDEVERIRRDAGASSLAASMAEAHELGVTATPAWWIDGRLLIPGAQPRETVQRWVTRLAERPAG